MNAGFLDVLHDSANDYVFAIRERVYVYFDGIFEEMIDEHRAVLRILDCLFHVADNGFFVVSDDHGAPAENVGGPHQHWVPNSVRARNGFFDRSRHGAWSLGDIEFVEQFAEAFAIFCQIDMLWRCADNAYARGLQWQGEIQRRLSAELHNHPDRRARRRFVFAYCQHVFEGQRLEVQAVTGVVIGGDGLGIAVDHDRLVTVVAKCECRVAAAVIEFNSLPYAIGSAAQDDYFLFRSWRRLVLFFIGGIEIRREALEFGGASIDTLVHRLNAMLLSLVANFVQIAFTIKTPGCSQPSVGKSHSLGFAQHVGRDRLHGMFLQLKLHVINFFELVEEPGIDRSHLGQLLDGVALTQCVANIRKALGMRRYQTLGENLGLDCFSADALSCVEGAHSFHQSLFKRAADGHYFAHGLHLRTEVLVCSRKFFELPLGNFYNDVVERRLETGRSLARDVVGDLIERVPYRQLGGNFGDRETGCFRGERRRARDSRIHLDHHHAAGGGMHAELNIRSAGLDANLANDGDGCIAHGLIFAVGESLYWSDGYRIAGVHAHGIEVFDRANNNDVVLEVAHHLKLIFFPTEHRFFDQGFVYRREIKAAGQNFHQLFAVVADAAAASTQREGRTHDDRKANFPGEFQAIFQIVYECRFRNVQTDLLHRVFEEEAIFCLLDGADLRTNQMHAVLF